MSSSSSSSSSRSIPFLKRKRHPAPRVLGLSSSGQSLPIHVGALRYLQDHTDILSGVDTVVAASGGALVGGLWAAGVPLEELCELSLTKDFSSSFRPSLNTLAQTGGAITQQDYQEEVIKMMAHSLGEEQARTLTLSQLQESLGKTVIFAVLRYGMRDLCRDTLGDTLWYLDPVNHPDLPLFQAIAIACTIPGVVEPAIIPGFDGVFFDGALMNASPFAGSDPQETLAIRLVQPVESTRTADARGLRRGAAFLMDMLKQTLAFTEELLLSTHHYHESFVDTHRVCEIDCRNFPSLVWKVPREKKEEMVRTGFDTMASHLERFFPEWITTPRCLLPLLPKKASEHHTDTQRSEETLREDDEEGAEEEEDEGSEEGEFEDEGPEEGEFEDEEEDKETLSVLIHSMMIEEDPSTKRGKKREVCILQ